MATLNGFNNEFKQVLKIAHLDRFLEDEDIQSPYEILARFASNLKESKRPPYFHVLDSDRNIKGFRYKFSEPIEGSGMVIDYYYYYETPYKV